MDYLFRVDVEQRPRGCVLRAGSQSKIQGDFFLWGRGRTNKRRKRGGRCPRGRSCLTNAGSCARRLRFTHTPWRPA